MCIANDGLWSPGKKEVLLITFVLVPKYLAAGIGNGQRVLGAGNATLRCETVKEKSMNKCCVDCPAALTCLAHQVMRRMRCLSCNRWQLYILSPEAGKRFAPRAHREIGMFADSEIAGGCTLWTSGHSLLWDNCLAERKGRPVYKIK